MKQGKIIAYSPAVLAGIIKSEDDRSHYFSLSQWLSKEIQPAHNLEVVFEEGHDGARNIKVKNLGGGE